MLSARTCAKGEGTRTALCLILILSHCFPSLPSFTVAVGVVHA